MYKRQALKGSIRPSAVASYKASAGSYNNNPGGWQVVQPQDRRNGLFCKDSQTQLRDITDGTTNTIAIGEVCWTAHQNARFFGGVDPDNGFSIDGMGNAGQAQRFMATTQYAMNLPVLTTPDNAPERAESFHSQHEGGVHFVLCDGSVRFISENIQHTTFLWVAANPYDRNGTPPGQNYGIYQRLSSKADGMVIGEF